MKQVLQQLEREALAAIDGASSLEALQSLRVRYVGRKGLLTAQLKALADMSVDERRDLGAFANDVKQRIERAFDDKERELERMAYDAIAREEWVDVTAPGDRVEHGHAHLVSQTIRDIEDVFHGIGFTRVPSREVDWEYFAFEGLNMPATHPARDDWETFFIDAPADERMGKQVLTPHTSNVQVRVMREYEPPLKVINLSRVYRRQSDASHTHMFHQFEGLCVGEKVTIADLKGTIEYFFAHFFDRERKVRYRPYHFRFTEPSFEIDINCDVCDGAGCKLCKEGWLELAGAGMTHPYVLRAGGVDPERYSAFAFGFGVERIAMMRGGVSIPDIRMLYQSDVRFLEQF